MSTITNYLNGNFILSNTIESSIVTLEYSPQDYSNIFNLLHYPLLAQADRFILVVDADAQFENQEKVQNHNSQKFHFIKYSFGQKLNSLFLQIQEQIKQCCSQFIHFYFLDSKLEILIKGYEIIQLSNSIKEVYQFFQDLLSIKEKLSLNKFQITLHLQTNNENQINRLIQKLASCRIIIEYENKNLKTEMIMKKVNGHSFIKNYYIDQEQLQNKRLKVLKEIQVKEEEKDPIQEMQDKVKSSFNMTVNSNQKQQKDQLDEQINPYKKMKNLSKTPLIYSDESDLKKMEIDLDEEDMDNEVDSDDDLDV